MVWWVAAFGDGSIRRRLREGFPFRLLFVSIPVVSAQSGFDTDLAFPDLVGE